jgi:hypothetical protein
MQNSTKSEDANRKDERRNVSIKITNSTLTCVHFVNGDAYDLYFVVDHLLYLPT